MKTPDLEKLRRLTLDEKTATPTYGRFVAEPFERGYGHPIGNSLRRILLSSLEGAAITSVRIKGALHEFAVIKGIKEDVASIVLNLKKVRLKMYTPGPETLYIKIKKEGVVTAKSIETNPNIEILNPEQEIATLDAGAELEIEMEICRGKGYVLAEESKAGKYPVNTITMDALFSPVVKVNYEVENTRVEQITNYDRLIMEIWTDGSVAPADALAYSAKVLKNSLSIFTGAEPEEPKVSTNEIQEEKMKEVSGFSERLITVAGRKDVNAKRAVAKEISNKEVMKKLFEVLVPRYEGRKGGFTRIYKLGTRKGDRASTAIIQLLA